MNDGSRRPANLPDKDKVLAVSTSPTGARTEYSSNLHMHRRRADPRHMLFSREWVLKDPHLVDEQLMLEEDRFVRESPHRHALQEIFQRSGIDYGRIDYTVADGRIQVFEINTNPIMLLGVSKLAPRRWESQASSARQINAALGKLDAGLPAADPARVQADARVYRRRMRIHRALRRLGIRPGKRL
jgi:hypothetical protein